MVKEADPEIVEEWKWRGVPTWSHDGIVCTGETYKNVVKMTFAKGRGPEDPSGLFNSSLEGNTRRAIDFHEGEKINEKALKTLVRAAVTLNSPKPSAEPKAAAASSGGEPARPCRRQIACEHGVALRSSHEQVLGRPLDREVGPEREDDGRI